VGKASVLDMLSDFSDMIVSHWQQSVSHYSLTLLQNITGSCLFVFGLMASCVVVCFLY